ncbi:hypothetical protein JW905_10990 [bacterium]|nr:hypothetical protein [candidate division CSSED10-310 bacterium]
MKKKRTLYDGRYSGRRPRKPAAPEMKTQEPAPLGLYGEPVEEQTDAPTENLFPTTTSARLNSRYGKPGKAGDRGLTSPLGGGATARGLSSTSSLGGRRPRRRSGSPVRIFIMALVLVGMTGGVGYLVFSNFTPPDTRQEHQSGTVTSPLVDSLMERVTTMYLGRHLEFPAIRLMSGNYLCLPGAAYPMTEYTVAATGETLRGDYNPHLRLTMLHGASEDGGLTISPAWRHPNNCDYAIVIDGGWYRITNPDDAHQLVAENQGRDSWALLLDSDDRLLGIYLYEGETGNADPVRFMDAVNLEQQFS